MAHIPSLSPLPGDRFRDCVCLCVSSTPPEFVSCLCLQHLYTQLGIELPEQSYGIDCPLYIPGQGINWATNKTLSVQHIIVMSVKEPSFNLTHQCLSFLLAPWGQMCYSCLTACATNKAYLVSFLWFAAFVPTAGSGAAGAIWVRLPAVHPWAGHKTGQLLKYF
jgi:hypothetical protein